MDSTQTGSAGLPTSNPGGGVFDPRDLIPTPILLFSMDGWLLWANTATERLVGRPLTALRGESFSILFPATMRHRNVRAILHPYRQSPHEFYVELPIRTAREAEHWVGCQVRRVKAGQDQWAYVVSVQDIQELHQMLESLKLRNIQLAARAKESAAAAQLRADFLTALSNELRVPLGGVITMTGMLLETSLDDHQSTLAEVVHESGRSVRELVDDILDFSRIESAQLEIASMDFDLRLTVNTVAASMAEEAAMHRLPFRFAVHHAVPSRVSGDPSRLRQVLQNVGRAIIRSVGDGSSQIAVEIRSDQETAYGVDLRFSVSVTPESSASSTRPPVAEVFASGDRAAACQFGGRGLALSIARHLVVLMGGTTGVQGGQGGSWAIWFSVPFGKQREHAIAEPEAVPDLKNLRVLLLVGEDAFRESLEDSIRRFAAGVECAPNANAALQSMRTAASAGSGFGCAIVHLEMPGVDAARFAQMVREEPLVAGVPLLLVAGLGRMGDSARAEQWGYAGYVAQPLPAELLHDMLLRLISQTATPDGAGPAALVTRHALAEQAKARRNVLVVEDSPVDQLVLVSALRRMGYEPEVVADGISAISVVEKGQVEIVLLDLGIPGVDGFQVAAAIRRLDRENRRVPILATTAHTSEDDRRRCLEMGMDEFIAKPVDLDRLCEAVERWLQRPAQPPVSMPTTPEVDQAPSPDADADADAGVLDSDRLMEFSMGRRELRITLVRTFFVNADDSMGKLRDAVRDNDAATAVFHAHRLKGMCATLGALRCYELLGSLESSAREGGSHHMWPLIHELDFEMSRLEGVLDRETGEFRDKAA